MQGTFEVPRATGRQSLLAQPFPTVSLSFVCACIALISYNSHHKRLSAEPGNNASAKALAVARRPKEASREKTRYREVILRERSSRRE